MRFRRPPWPFRTRAWRRSRLLALSALLPVVLLACLVLADQGSRFVEGHGRVEVWVREAPAAVEAMSATRLHVPMFGPVERLRASGRRVPPPGCRSGIALSVRGLRDSELDMARDMLIDTAAAVGLRPCGQAVFIFDDLPGPLDSGDLGGFAFQAVLWAAIPMAVVALLFWAAMARFPLALALAWSRWDVAALRSGLAVGLGLALALELVAWLVPASMPSSRIPPGPGFLVLMLLLYPLLHEVAFRAWALALAMQVHGPRFALYWSTGLQMLANAGSPAAAAQALVSGLVLGRLFLHRQALPECAIALSVCTGLRLLLPW